MKRTYDIRNIYVAKIARQGDVYEFQEPVFHPWYDGVKSFKKGYNWDYSDEKLGLFVKTIGGYKHILTGTTYKVANRKTGGEFVVDPEEIHEVCKYDKNLAKFLITNNNTYRITLEQIYYMEDRFNNELKTDLEENGELNV